MNEDIDIPEVKELSALEKVALELSELPRHEQLKALEIASQLEFERFISRLSWN